MFRPISLSILTSIGLALAGCNATPPKRDPAYAAMRPVVISTPEVNNGAIYQAGYEKSWFEDLRARRVGDMLTIKLVEKTKADKKAKHKKTWKKLLHFLNLFHPSTLWYLQFRAGDEGGGGDSKAGGDGGIAGAGW